MKTLILIDGSGFVFRAFHALPPLSTPQGIPTGAVLGFSNMILKLKAEHHPTHWAIAFDKGRSTFRQGLFPLYKAHRPEAPAEIILQFSIIKEFCAAIRLPIVEEQGLEADDLIASYTKKAVQENWAVCIVSSDKDMAQLVSNPVKLFDPLKNVVYDEGAIQDRWGVSIAQIPFVQALAGDTSDNIPGIPGIGIKTATKWIQQLESLENVLTRYEEIPRSAKQKLIPDYADQARLCYQLVRLKDDVSPLCEMDHFSYQEPDTEKLEKFLDHYDMRGLKNRLIHKSFFNPKISEPLPMRLLSPDVFLTRLGRTGIVSLVPHQVEGRLVGAVGTSFPIEKQSAQDILETSEGQSAYLDMDALKDLFHTDACLKILYDGKTWLHQLDQAWGPDAKSLEIPAQSLDLGHTSLTFCSADQQCILYPYDDVMLLSYAVYGGHEKHDLNTLIARVSPHSSCASLDLERGARDLIQERNSDPLALERLYHQANSLLQVWHILKKQLREKHLAFIYEKVDLPLVPVLTQMEKRGICIDASYLKILSQQFVKEIQELEKEIYDKAGMKFLIGSPKQLGHVLFEHLQWPGGKKGKSGAYQTSSLILQFFADQGQELAQLLLQWRQLTKLNSTYTEALLAQVNADTGRLSTTYSMITTSTGRLSSLNPNLQNIPIRTAQGRQIRHAFHASQGSVLLSLDYSQIELRLLAHMGHIPLLKEAFIKHQDIHAQTACDLFQCTLDQVTPDMRRSAKTINFGLLYGMSAFGLSQRLKIKPAEAKGILQRYFDHYPGIVTYLENCKTEARQKGYVCTLWGRRCIIPHMNSSNYLLRTAAERQAINAPLQGTSADLMKRAMIHVSQWLWKKPLQAKIVLQIHDELLLEVPQSQLEVTRTAAQRIMESVISLSVPLEVHATVGFTWDVEARVF